MIQRFLEWVEEDPARFPIAAAVSFCFGTVVCGAALVIGYLCMVAVECFFS